MLKLSTMDYIGFKIDEAALNRCEKTIVKEAEQDASGRCGYQKWLIALTPRSWHHVMLRLQQPVEDPSTGEVLTIHIPTDGYYGNQKDSCSKQCGQELPLCGPRLFEYNSAGR